MALESGGLAGGLKGLRMAERRVGPGSLDSSLGSGCKRVHGTVRHQGLFHTWSCRTDPTGGVEDGNTPHAATFELVLVEPLTPKAGSGGSRPPNPPPLFPLSRYMLYLPMANGETHSLTHRRALTEEEEEEEERRRQERRIKRIEPVGRADSSLEYSHVFNLDGLLKPVEVSNGGGPLGIHVLPLSSQDARPYIFYSVSVSLTAQQQANARQRTHAKAPQPSVLGPSGVHTALKVPTLMEIKRNHVRFRSARNYSLFNTLKLTRLSRLGPRERGKGLPCVIFNFNWKRGHRGAETSLRTQGLLVKRLERGGKAEQERLFQENDCIVKINQGDIRHLRFEQAQNIFKQAMRGKSILFHVVPAAMKRQYELLMAQTELSPAQPNRVRFSQVSLQLGDSASLVGAAMPRSGPQPGVIHDHQGPLAGSTPEPNRRFVTLPHTLLTRTSSVTSPSLQRRISTNQSVSSYTKNKGRRFNIQLKKGTDG
ncbi:Partitioning defective 3 [Liparis tanakae]|uniref:Partitioning defective 3 n=1 Tax=Liparis tanakae TaxID=230148 RepID=A0A4Z2ICF7_9TELE|nr:Partitioning defective 3 [Liparis tanakae]